MITENEAKEGVKVRILVERKSSKFKKGLNKDDIGFIKFIHGDPWKNSSDMIWVIKNKKGKSRSYGFQPEYLKIVID